MAVDNGQAEEFDLDRTDRLPILAGTLVDDDVADDAERMEYSAPASSIKSDFPRPSAVDLPSLADSVRSVEERITRRNAEYEALKVAHEKACEAEARAVSRSQELAAELVEIRAAFESQQTRSREINDSLAAKVAGVAGAQTRMEEALRDAERHQSESRALRDTLAARDATIVQVLQSLSERDAELSALQHEHAQIVPVLEERSKTGTQLDADLRAAQARTVAMAAELKNTQESVVTLTTQLKLVVEELASTRRELGTTKTQAGAYLEQLRTREWRRGFDHNMFRELDTKIGAVQEGHGVIKSERDLLRQRIAEIESKLAARDESIATLNAAAMAEQALRVKQEQDFHRIERARTALEEKIAAMESDRRELDVVLATQRDSIAGLTAAATAGESLRNQHEHDLQYLDGSPAADTAQSDVLEHERSRFNAELAAKDRTIDEALEAGVSEVERIKEALLATEEARAELQGDVRQLQSEAQIRADEMAVLKAQLQDARRPGHSLEAQVKRLTDDLSAKALTLDALVEENRNLRLGVERTRAALEERDFLIRRLERSESNNASVLGRIQTSIENLGVPANSDSVAAPAECTAALVRLDGEVNTTHPLARRTRIGRAPGCELQIDSSSVSRHHALMLMGHRDLLIEDLNSTNGVMVNGRKISKQLLADGDLLTIGEAQFRLMLHVPPRVGDTPAVAPQ